MHRTRTLTIALVAGVLAAPAAADAASLKGTVVGPTYVSGPRAVVPVLFTSSSVKKAKLKSPLGTVTLPRTSTLPGPGGVRVAIGQLRIGDVFTAMASVPKAQRRSSYPQLRLAGTRTKLTQRATVESPAELSQQIAALQAELGRVKTSMAQLATYTVGELSKLRVDVASLQTGLTGVQTQLKGLETTLSSVSLQVTQLSATVEASITQLTATVTSLTSQVTTVVGQVTAITNQLNGIVTQIVGLDPSALTSTLSQLAALQGQLGDLTGTVTGLATGLTGLTGTVTGLAGQVTGLDSDLDGLTTTVDGLAGDLADIDTLLNDPTSGLVGQVTELSDTLDVVCGLPLIVC